MDETQEDTLPIDLTDQETALALHILQGAYQDIREEIYKTDHSTFRDQLVARRDALASLIRKLGGDPEKTSG
jgi:hypothetical protein